MHKTYGVEMIDYKAKQIYDVKMSELIAENNVHSDTDIKNFHYILEDSEYACQKSDQDKLKTLEGYTFISNIDKYKTWSRNAHHWTTSYVWNKFIPRFCKDFSLPFNTDDFSEVPYKEQENGKEYDVTFHYPNNNGFYSLYMRDNAITGSHSTVMRELDNSFSLYHGLFRGWHRCCVVKNHNAETSRVLFLNCDSMSIPVIPILIRYYKAIIVSDNRNGTKFITGSPKYFNNEDLKITDWCTLGLARNYCVSLTFEYRAVCNNKIFKQNMQ